MIRAIQFQNKRVGSTFLQKALNSHPQIAGIDEVFVNQAKKEGMKKSGFDPFLRSNHNKPEQFIRKVIWAKYPHKNVIFKIMYNQINYHAGLRMFIKENKLPIIHLMRKNLVKQVISGQTAHKTMHDPLNITAHNLLHFVEKADTLNKQWQERFKAHKKIELFYEDIIGEKDNQFTYVDKSVNIAICDFFGVKHIPMYTNTKKKNKEDIWVYLPNRQTVEKEFKGTKYEWMIHDNR